jgi:hypothetical protein
MVEQALLPAIEKTIQENEIGGGSPYVLDFARKGKSGASFGFMQGDTNASQQASHTLAKVLAAAEVAQRTIDRIIGVLGKPLPGGKPSPGTGQRVP